MTKYSTRPSAKRSRSRKGYSFSLGLLPNSSMSIHCHNICPMWLLRNVQTFNRQPHKSHSTKGGGVDDSPYRFAQNPTQSWRRLLYSASWTDTLVLRQGAYKTPVYTMQIALGSWEWNDQMRVWNPPWRRVAVLAVAAAIHEETSARRHLFFCNITFVADLIATPLLRRFHLSLTSC